MRERIRTTTKPKLKRERVRTYSSVTWKGTIALMDSVDDCVVCIAYLRDLGAPVNLTRAGRAELIYLIRDRIRDINQGY